jgi:steroid 5-alpha reductase family enzyme
VVALTRSGNALGALDYLAAVVGISAAVIELIADEQMRSFGRKKAPGAIMESGLWRFSRHPNYFGEILLWLSLFIFAIAVGLGFWWTCIGVIAMIAMFLGASIPMLDGRSEARRPAFADYRRRTSALIPLPPKK